MLRPFVGSFSTFRSRAAISRVAAAFGPRSRIASVGALDVAWDGDDDGAQWEAPVLCLLDGFVDNLADLRPEDERRNGASPEADIARGWSRFGADFVARLRGDFALLLWDERSHSGLIARDQKGARSVYLHEGQGRLVFATEIRYLLAALERTPDPDAAALATWVGRGELRGGRTLFSGIRKLPPGHLLTFEGERWRRRSYWTPMYEGTLGVDREEAVGLVRGGLERAVGRVMQPDTATAVQLSGGLDSSTIAALAMRSPRDSPLAGYSATFPRFPAMDETALINTLTTHIGLPSRQLRVHGGSVLSGGLEYVRQWLVPLASPNLHYQLPLFHRMAADGVRVVLDGEGGDELFGAVRHLMADRVRRGRLLAAVRLARSYPGAGSAPPWPTVLRFVAHAGVKTALPHHVHQLLRRTGDQSRHVSPWLSANGGRLCRETEDPWAWERLRGPRWWAYLADLMIGAMDAADSFAHLNRRAATTGLEPRHPLHDLDLIRLMLRLPPELAFDPHLSRPLLRAGVEGLVPDAIRLRPSKGVFEPLFHAGLEGDLPVIRELLAPGAEVGTYVDLDRVWDGLLGGPDACPLGRFVWAEDLWRIVASECWLRELAEPGFASRLMDSGQLAQVETDFFSGALA